MHVFLKIFFFSEKKELSILWRIFISLFCHSLELICAPQQRVLGWSFCFWNRRTPNFLFSYKFFFFWKGCKLCNCLQIVMKSSGLFVFFHFIPVFCVRRFNFIYYICKKFIYIISFPCAKSVEFYNRYIYFWKQRQIIYKRSFV